MECKYCGSYEDVVDAVCFDCYENVVPRSEILQEVHISETDPRFSGST